jgi:hypothetical protein
MRLSSTRLFSFVALASILVASSTMLAGCAKKSDQAKTDSTHITTDTAKTTAVIAIIPADSSMDFPNAKLLIVSPREGQVLTKASDSVGVIMNVTGMELGLPTGNDSARGVAYSKQGSHVHVIIDEKPYMADYKNGQPFMVGMLAAGKHTIRAFPSRSYHESVKSAGAFATRTFYVENGPEKGMKDTMGPDLKAPMLTYSRPKGTYTAAEAQKLLLDFYVSNAKLGPKDYSVDVTVDGKEISKLTKWQAYYITGLGTGKHTIQLALLDKDGKIVAGAFNAPKMEITVQ